MSQQERQERRLARHESFMAGQEAARKLFAVKPMTIAVLRALAAMERG